MHFICSILPCCVACWMLELIKRDSDAASSDNNTALDRDCPSMHLDKSLCQGKTYPRTGMMDIGLVEILEYMPDMLL